MKVALVGPDAFTIWQFRRGLIEALQAQDVEVHILTSDDAFVDRVKSLGVIYHSVPFTRFISPWKDLVYALSLWRIFSSEGFDIVHNFTVKPNTYGALAAKFAGVPRIIDMVEGLGFSFSSSTTVRDGLLKQAVSLLYRIGFAVSDCVWFLNEDDMKLMVSSGIAKSAQSVLIRSTGVNITEYSMSHVDQFKLANIRSEIGVKQRSVVVTMIVSRLVWSKGVAEFVQAAQILREPCPNARFLLVGPMDDTSPESVPSTFLQESLPANMWWSSFREDIREILAVSDIVVLPSYYGEGVPRILLEAMALGKPLVTTDNVGCRETVENGKNGFLVPVRNSKALADAIAILIQDSAKREAYGQYSQTKVQQEFDETYVVQRALKELYLLPA